MTKKNKLLLINVVDTSVVETSNRFIPIHRLTSFQPLALGIIAAMTPDNWDVEIIDENFEEFRYIHADFVGLSSYSMSINRAYDISKQYLSKNIPVIIGGVHATLFPQEAQLFCSSVFTGEVENVWGQIIHDFENNCIKSQYDGGYTDLSQSIIPNRNVFLKYNYEIATIEFSRGCPYNCSFCGVSIISGKKLRYKPIDIVITELKEIKQRYVIFKDDNLIGNTSENKANAIELFQKIIDNNIKKDFLCFVSINIAQDDALLKLARKAGFVLFFIGIETEKIKAIRSINKTVNEDSAKNLYKDTFKRIHKAKIAITAAFICGFDTDTVKDVEERASFIKKSSLDTFTFTFLTPLPKTKLFLDFEKNDRLIFNKFPEDWIYYNFCHLTYKIENYEDMQKVIYHYMDRLHSAKFFKQKLLVSLINTKSIRTTVAAYVFNKHNHVFLKKSKILNLIEKTYLLFCK